MNEAVARYEKIRKAGVYRYDNRWIVFFIHQRILKRARRKFCKRRRFQ